jgi:hypothetical protein
LDKVGPTLLLHAIIMDVIVLLDCQECLAVPNKNAKLCFLEMGMLRGTFSSMPLSISKAEIVLLSKKFSK